MLGSILNSHGINRSEPAYVSGVILGFEPTLSRVSWVCVSLIKGLFYGFCKLQETMTEVRDFGCEAKCILLKSSLGFFP